ncbi:hypothetical protein [Enterococcus gallinarum]|uniref:hypothetical protein n=1 Tax=Enterococcus gallinarum TaxID=1353 RepID=UPI0012E31A38|nr:hypothetical protein [Enterococcus gallinarum]MUN91285.1 hypothetical protein [Enterococcus gallinarum]
MREYINEGQETLDWAVKNNQVFLIMFLLIFIIFLYVLFKAYRMLILERIEVKEERKQFLETLNKQQSLINDQQRLLEEEKKLFERMNKTVNDINTKIDVVIQQKG